MPRRRRPIARGRGRAACAAALVAACTVPAIVFGGSPLGEVEGRRDHGELPVSIAEFLAGIGPDPFAIDAETNPNEAGGAGEPVASDGDFLPPIVRSVAAEETFLPPIPRAAVAESEPVLRTKAPLLTEADLESFEDREGTAAPDLAPTSAVTPPGPAAVAAASPFEEVEGLRPPVAFPIPLSDFLAGVADPFADPPAAVDGEIFLMPVVRPDRPEPAAVARAKAPLLTEADFEVAAQAPVGGVPGPDGSEPDGLVPDGLRPDAPSTPAEAAATNPFEMLPTARLRSIRSVRVSLAIDGEETQPAETEAVRQVFAAAGTIPPRPPIWPGLSPNPMTFRFRHSPLWFEDPNLERCGHACCGPHCQPLFSGVYFFANTATIPYRFAAEPQCETVFAKPFCPRCRRYSFCENYLPPPSVKGAALQTAATIGLIFLIP